MKKLEHVSTEMSLHVLAYNMKRVINLVGVRRLSASISFYTASARNGRLFSPDKRL